MSATAGTTTLRLRLGPAGALTEPIIQSTAPANVASKTSFPIVLEGLITCRTAGASGTLMATLMATGPTIAAAGAAAGVTAAQAVDTTQPRVLQLTGIGTAGNSIVFHDAVVEVVKS